MRLENQQRGRGLSRDLITIDRRGRNGRMVEHHDPNSMTFEGGSQPWSRRDRDTWNTSFLADVNHPLNRLDGRGNVVSENMRLSRGDIAYERDKGNRARRMDGFLQTMAGAHNFHSRSAHGSRMGDDVRVVERQRGRRHPWSGYEFVSPPRSRSRGRESPSSVMHGESSRADERPFNAYAADLARVAQHERNRRHGFP